MKRTIAAILALCLLLFARCGETAEERINKTIEMAEKLNASSSLPIDLLTPKESNAEYSELSPQAKYEYDEQHEFIYHCYYNSYPSNAEKKSITSILLFTNDYNVFGVEVGMVLDDAEEKLTAAGLKRKRPTSHEQQMAASDNCNMYLYTYGDLRVIVETPLESDVINAIKVNL